jgi:hypothetical protein|tara:strand:- start:971 stop:1615 length:645 start_codon:yes stop_codon:yes gene_type:complete
MFKYLIFGPFLFLVFTTDVKTRPISYPNGWTIMQMNDVNKNSVHIHLSPSVKYSLGYRAEYWRKKEWQFHGAQFNYLINRINTSKSQSNFYIRNGVGVALSNYKHFQNKVLPSFFTGLLFDWENRNYFVSYENRINNSLSIEKFYQQKLRFGLAPYIGKYGDLHTWFMFQIDHMPNSSDNLVFTPFVRIFKGDYLAEIGLSYHNDFMFNFIKRF